MECGSVDMVAKLRASVSSMVDVVELGRFFVDENANSTEAVSSVSFFSDDPISGGIEPSITA